MEAWADFFAALAEVFWLDFLEADLPFLPEKAASQFEAYLSLGPTRTMVTAGGPLVYENEEDRARGAAGH